MKENIILIKGDITLVDADAIVNAANSRLLGGGGVDGAIHRAAGPGLLDECRKLNGCPPGEAKITQGYNLRAGHVIHTVGPVWHGGQNDEESVLASCYKNSLSLAKDNSIRTIAFPAVSTGVYGFPKNLAAMIAVSETRRFLESNSLPEKVIFVVFDDENYNIYKSFTEI